MPLLDDIIQYLKRERELYGDFNPAAKLDGPLPESTESNEASSSNTAKVQEPESKEYSSTKNASNNERPDIVTQIKSCTSLSELEQLCRQADVLHTDLEGTNLVFGVGNPHADLMLIGEAPGAQEDKQGEPFVGPAGQLLNKILAAINFKREDVYIANILKHRPPNNRNPLPEERKRSLPFLLKQIELIDPKLILSLGKVSAQTLLDKSGSLSSMRGRFHPFQKKYELLATYHPAALLRHAKWKRPVWEDVQLLRKRYDELGGTP